MTGDIRDNRLVEQRQENLDAMSSPASLALGGCAILLVGLVCIFYDSPAMQTPRLLASLFRSQGS